MLGLGQPCDGMISLVFEEGMTQLEYQSVIQAPLWGGGWGSEYPTSRQFLA